MKIDILENHCEIRNGYAFKSKDFIDNGIPVIRIGDISEGEVKLEKAPRIRENISYNKYVLKKGDILIAMSGATTGKIGLYKDSSKSYQNQRVGCFIPNTKTLYSKYLYSFLKSISPKIIKKAYGGGQPNISTREISKFKIPLPSLIDQKRIAQVLTDCEELIGKRKKSIELLDELVKSTFLEMFGDPQQNPKGYKKKKLKEVADFLTGYPFKSKDYSEEGINICGGLIITPKYIDWSNAKKWSVNKIEGLENFFLKNGDIVVAMDRPWISSGFKIGKILEEDIPSLLIQRTARIRGTEINQEFLFYSLKSRSFENHCKPTETTIPHISPKDFYSYDVLIPSPKLQNQFAQIVEKVEETKKLYQEHLKELENLYARLSQDAFKGELDLSKVVLREEFLVDEEVVSPEKISKEQKTYKKIKIDKSYLKEPKNKIKTKRDITNMTLADFYGIPDEIQATQEDLDFQFRGDDLFYQFLLKDHFKNKSFDYQELQKQFQSYFIQNDVDMEYESWKKVIFKFIEATPPLIKQEFDEQKGRIKLKLTDEAFKA